MDSRYFMVRPRSFHDSFRVEFLCSVRSATAGRDVPVIVTLGRTIIALQVETPRQKSSPQRSITNGRSIQKPEDLKVRKLRRRNILPDGKGANAD
jgi:hypothetical protein